MGLHLNRMSPLRREVLMRLADRGPMPLWEALQGRRNVIPKLLMFGWTTSESVDRITVHFNITEAGRKALVNE